ncbi:MAG: phospholipase [Rhodobacterales bacterium]|nr:MAG: phospholipase [Rhodobacterales bacterium]
MSRELHFKRRPPVSGEAKSLVVFLHGYGADGADLLGLADPLGPHMPDTVFIAPDAPEPCAGNPMGFQWFPIPWIDGSSEELAADGVRQAVGDVDAFITRVLAEEGIAPDRLVVFGFSQGAMLALQALVKRDAPVAGIVACSGRVLEPERFAGAVRVKPPVLLMHGDQDEVVPPAHFDEAGQLLEAAGFEVYGHIMEGTGHGIAPDGLSVALAFMADKLGIGLNAG